MTAYTNKCHLARAAIEATCFQTRAILECMARDSNTPFLELYVDGGLTASNVAMQIQADILGLPVVRPAMKEPTALGSAIAAGLAVGIWSDLDDVKRHQAKSSKTAFEPSLDPVVRDKHYRQWDRAVERARGWLVDSDCECERSA
jgi:glycerol kinase